MSSNIEPQVITSFQEFLDYPGNFAFEEESLRSWVRCACFLLISAKITVFRQFLRNHIESNIIITDVQNWFDERIELTWELQPRIEHGSVALSLLSLSKLEPYIFCRYFSSRNGIDLRFLPTDAQKTELLEISGTLKEEYFRERIREKMKQFQKSKLKGKGWVSVFCFETTTNALHRMENK